MNFPQPSDKTLLKDLKYYNNTEILQRCWYVTDNNIKLDGNDNVPMWRIQPPDSGSTYKFKYVYLSLNLLSTLQNLTKYRLLNQNKNPNI